MSKILLLEDDKVLRESLKELLTDENYEVYSCSDSDEALELSSNMKFDLYLFDINLNGDSGFDTLDALRKANDVTPTIFLTSLDDIKSQAKGFEVGGDDYVKKPFDFDELLIRINAQLRRSYNSTIDKIQYNQLTYIISSNELYQDNKLISCTPQESKLLSILFKNIDTTIQKDDILYELNDGGESSEGALRVYINKLRNIGLSITTLKSIGYRLEKA